MRLKPTDGWETMSFQEKNFAVSLVNFSLILVFFLIQVLQLVRADRFVEAELFRLAGIVIALAIVVTILATILTHIVSAIIEAIRTKKEPVLEDIADERDRLIDLRGTRITYALSSTGVLISMLTFVFGQPPLVMFTSLIFFGLVAQVVGDSARLLFYRRGF